MTLMDKENNIKPRLFACTCGYYPAGTLLPLRGAWQKGTKHVKAVFSRRGFEMS